MRKIIYALFVILILASCDKEKAHVPDEGQYVYSDENYTVAIYVYPDDDDCGITIFENGSYVWQDVYSFNNISGSWPEYEFKFSKDYKKLTLECSYSNESTFTAMAIENSTGVKIPVSMLFKRDKRMLDKNKDGILDERQPELFGKSNLRIKPQENRSEGMGQS